MISLVKKIIPTVVPSRSNSSNAEIIIKILQGKYDLFENPLDKQVLNVFSNEGTTPQHKNFSHFNCHPATTVFF